jgi:hypothetical protein
MNILQNEKNNFFFELQKDNYCTIKSKKEDWKEVEIPLTLNDLDFRDYEETEFERIEDK